MAKTYSCMDCGASVWRRSSRCATCYATHRRLISPNTFTCEHCGASSHRKKGGANKVKGYANRWCSHECYVTARREARKAAPFCTVHLNQCAVCNAQWAARRKQIVCSDKCRQEKGRSDAHNRYKLRRDAQLRARLHKICACCSKPFVPLYGGAKYCSETCSARVDKKRYGTSYRARARHHGVTYETLDRLKVFERDGWCCQICGKHTPLSRMGKRYSNSPELDHRVPMALGGPHSYANTQCACRGCNQRKAAVASVGQMPLFQVAPTTRHVRRLCRGLIELELCDVVCRGPLVLRNAITINEIQGAG
jgi:hypothetical protein